MINDVYTWSDDMYPIVKKSFEERYASRVNAIATAAGIVKQDALTYKINSLGGYGELPAYSAGTLARGDNESGFITTVTPTERALAVPVSYKDVKHDLVGEATRTGIRLADSAYITVLTQFYNMFGNAFTTLGSDGVAWASNAHPVNNDSSDNSTYSNLITTALSLNAIKNAKAQASGFETSDGLPFVADFDLLLVGPDLEATAREICGADAAVSPVLNPETGIGGNPAYGMRYMVVGGGGHGFSNGKWAIADSALLREVFKLVYITEPSVLVSPRENPLVTDYIAYVDFAFGFGDGRPIVFSSPSTAL